MGTEIIDLSNKEIINIIQKIAKNESLKYGINININIISKHDYFKKNAYNTTFSLAKNILVFYSKGLYLPSTNDNENKIFVFFNENHQLLSHNKEQQLINLMCTAYHEIRHFLQHNVSNIFNNFELFIFAYENSYIQDIGQEDYNNYHDDFYVEIDAQLYAIKNALNYLENHQNISKKIKKDLSDMLKKLEIRKNNFNFNYVFTKICKDLKDRPTFYSYDESLFLQIFWNKNGSFKSIDEILESPFLGSISEDTIYSVLSSDAYLKSVDYKKIDVESEKVLYDALQFYHYNLLQRKKINKTFFSNKDIYYSQFTEYDYFFNEEIFKIKKNFNLLFKEKYEFEKIDMNDYESYLPTINFSYYTR